MYDRTKAVEYALQWANSRNPAFTDFEELGGDCTNFVSQCLYAGTGEMNFTPIYGWYYINIDQRTASWSGVAYLYDFLVANIGPGPCATNAQITDMMPGDVIQLGDVNDHFYHSLIITRMTGYRPSRIFVTTHSDDARQRRLSTYQFENIRFLHINDTCEQT